MEGNVLKKCIKLSEDLGRFQCQIIFFHFPQICFWLFTIFVRFQIIQWRFSRTKAQSTSNEVAKQNYICGHFIHRVLKL